MKTEEINQKSIEGQLLLTAITELMHYTQKPCDDILKLLEYKNKKSYPLNYSSNKEALELCPVCQGRSKLPNNFYNRSNATSSNEEDVTCKSCEGLGYIKVE